MQVTVDGKSGTVSTIDEEPDTWTARSEEHTAKNIRKNMHSRCYDRPTVRVPIRSKHDCHEFCETTL